MGGAYPKALSRFYLNQALFRVLTNRSTLNRRLRTQSYRFWRCPYLALSQSGAADVEVCRRRHYASALFDSMHGAAYTIAIFAESTVSCALRGAQVSTAFWLPLGIRM